MRRRAFAINGIGSALIGSACSSRCSGTAAAQNAAEADKPRARGGGGHRHPREPAELHRGQARGHRLHGFDLCRGHRQVSRLRTSPSRSTASPASRSPARSSGEGLNIAIRGLGTNFTRVLLNNAPVAVASTGRTDCAEHQPRSRPGPVSHGAVHAAHRAQELRGQHARRRRRRHRRTCAARGRSTTPGSTSPIRFQGTKNTEADDWGGRGSMLASKTWDNFGVLVGVAGVRNKVRTTRLRDDRLDQPQSDGADARAPRLTDAAQAQCLATTGCNGTGGGNWTIPATVPANAGNGLTPGDDDRQRVPARAQPGAHDAADRQRAHSAPRPARRTSSAPRIATTASSASNTARPTTLHFYLDSMYGKKENDLQRIDMNWVGRNGAIIPLNMTVDRDRLQRRLRRHQRHVRECAVVPGIPARSSRTRSSGARTRASSGSSPTR